MEYKKRKGIYIPESMSLYDSGYGEGGASLFRRALKGFTAVSSSPQSDIDEHNETLRSRSRMLYMTSPIATSAIKTNRTNVVGVGLELKSRIDRETLGMTPEQAEAWQHRTELEFAIWAENKRNCDAIGVNTFYGIQQLALLSWLMSGDAIVLIKALPTDGMHPYALRLHLIEADRVATPTAEGAYGIYGTDKTSGNRIYDGVEIDEHGAVTAYHIRSTYKGDYRGGVTEWSRIAAYQELTGIPNVLHIMDSERPDQYRGVTYLAQIIEPLLQLRRYTEAELMAAIIEAFFTVFVKTDSGDEENPFNETNETPGGELRSPNDYNMGSGNAVFLKKGEDVVFGDPKRPADGFPGFLKAITQQVGAALEIPADLLLKDFNASYSASRAALLEAWKSFKMRRKWLTDSLCKPVYEIFMSEAVARGRIYAPGFFSDPIKRMAYLGSEWIGPSQGQIDPVKEITAEILACGEGFSTHEQSTIKINGGNWDSNVERLLRENEKLMLRGADAHQEGGEAQGGRQEAQNSRREVQSGKREAFTARTVRASIRDAIREMVREEIENAKK